MVLFAQSSSYIAWFYLGRCLVSRRRQHQIQILFKTVICSWHRQFRWLSWIWTRYSRGLNPEQVSCYLYTSNPLSYRKMPVAGRCVWKRGCGQLIVAIGRRSIINIINRIKYSPTSLLPNGDTMPDLEWFHDLNYPWYLMQLMWIFNIGISVALSFVYRNQIFIY